MVFVGGVVVNSLCSIAAGRIESDLVFAICDLTAASLLIDRAEDVEKLADAFEFGITGFCVHFGKSHTNEAGCGRKITRKSESTHAAAVSSKPEVIRKCICRLLWRQVHIVV